jgi:hypothetical protein
LTQARYRYQGIGGNIPIPEWTEEEIDDLERLDVHGSRCRCSYCKIRSDELTFERHCRAERRKAEAEEREAAAEARSSARVQALANELREQLERVERAHAVEPWSVIIPVIKPEIIAEYIRQLPPDVRISETEQELLRQSRRNPNVLYTVHVESTGTVRRDPAGRRILPPDPYYGIVWC